MKVEQVMAANPVTVRPDTSAASALRRLAQRQVTMLPVVDARDRIVGVVAEGDLLGRAPAVERVGDVMRHLTALVHPETDVATAGRLLVESGVKSLPVVDASDRVVGVVSRSDLVRLHAREDAELQQEIVDALCRAGIRGWRVQVHNGVVDLTAPRETDGGECADAVLVADLARVTIGVRAVEVR